eukprot:5079020-Alexandrium_andersonii.AAC.1
MDFSGARVLERSGHPPPGQACGHSASPCRVQARSGHHQDGVHIDPSGGSPRAHPVQGRPPCK